MRRLKQRRRETGETTPRSSRPKSAKKVLAEHSELLRTLVRRQLDTTLEELRAELPVAVSVTTVYGAEEVVIPATAGIRKGVWFPIRQGIRGLIAEAGGAAAAYMLVEPSTHYFKVMTRSERMPVLIGERI